MYEFEEPIAKPSLVEPGVKYFFYETLKQCHQIKEKYYNHVFNAGMFIFFMIVLGGILLYKYKGKLTPAEKKQREIEKRQYVLSTIKNYQDEKRKMRQELITGLPSWDNSGF
jgi:hypothetical protein